MELFSCFISIKSSHHPYNQINTLDCFSCCIVNLLGESPKTLTKKMSLTYGYPNPRTFQQRPFATYNKHTPTQPASLSPVEGKITFIQPNNLPHSLAQTKTYNHQQNYLQAGNYPKNSNSNKLEISPKKADSIQKIKATGLGSQSTVDKKFVPLSYEKVNLDEERGIGQKISENENGKKTVLTVLLGFLILMVIVGVFYGIILYDKSKSVPDSMAGNMTVRTDAKSSSVSRVEINKMDTKIEREDESKVSSVLSNEINGENKISHPSQGQQGSRQSHLTRRKHIK